MLESNYPRDLSLKAGFVRDLVAFEGSSTQLKQLVDAHRPRQEKGGYHRSYSLEDVRFLRKHLLGITKPAKKDGLPPLLVFHMTKGGVGKTTLSVNAAVGIAMYGHKTLIIDADPQGTASEMLGVDTANEELIHIGHLMQDMVDRKKPRFEEAVRSIYPGHMLDLIPADISLVSAHQWLVNATRREEVFRRLLESNTEFFGQYEAIVVDTAPSTSVLTQTILDAADKTVLTPVTMDGQSLKALHVMASILAELNLGRKDRSPLSALIVPNAYRNSVPLSRQALERLISEFGSMLSNQIVPYAPAFPRQFDISGGDKEENLPTLEREPNTSASKAILQLSEDLIAHFDIRLDGHTDPRFRAAAAA